MKTTSLNTGWAIVIISGLLPRETAKLRRALLNRGARKENSGTFFVPCGRGLSDLAQLAKDLKALGTRETIFSATYITRAQMEKTIICHGKPSEP